MDDRHSFLQSKRRLAFLSRVVDIEASNLLAHHQDRPEKPCPLSRCMTFQANIRLRRITMRPINAVDIFSSAASLLQRKCERTARS